MLRTQSKCPGCGSRLEFGRDPPLPPPTFATLSSPTAPIAAPAPVAQAGDWGAFLTFRWLLAPYLIRGIYAIGMLIITLSALAPLVGNGSVGSFVQAAVVLIGGNIVWRLICEGLILAFAVYERLGHILDELRRR